MRVKMKMERGKKRGVKILDRMAWEGTPGTASLKEVRESTL